MNGPTFDRITRLLAERSTRRAAVAAGSTGLGAVAAAALGSSARAQSATPVAVATPATDAPIDLLFVQTFGSASVVPQPNDDGAITLTREEGTGQTVYFSDRPERLVGTLSNEQFLNSQAFDPSDPPNAALVTLSDGIERVMLVELTEPELDPTTGAVTYTVRPLEGQPEGEELASLAARRTDDAIGDLDGAVTLFIDDLSCSPDGAGCNTSSDCCSGWCCDSIEMCPPYLCTPTSS